MEEGADDDKLQKVVIEEEAKDDKLQKEEADDKLQKEEADKKAQERSAGLPISNSNIILTRRTVPVFLSEIKEYEIKRS